jgi:transcriptional regulator with GAF, ATPase, and Fis domain
MKSNHIENVNSKHRFKAVNMQHIVGISDSIKRINEMIEIVAPTDARVLITGKNGVGKELIAKWIHEKSYRNEGPMVEVNCAAIPNELIESELFGHEKGSFTSALKQHSGKFEQANGGTLFLDEIGDMSLSAQAKVLRVLQEKIITRVGADRSIPVDVRVITANNKDLIKECRMNNFRLDLYHRIAVIIINVPSLNERAEDIPVLIDYFLEQLSQEYGWPVKSIEPQAVFALQQHYWSGNIRELKNVVERLVILSGEIITLTDVVNFVSPEFNLDRV